MIQYRILGKEWCFEDSFATILNIHKEFEVLWAKLFDEIQRDDSTREVFIKRTQKYIFNAKSCLVEKAVEILIGQGIYEISEQDFFEKHINPNAMDKEVRQCAEDMRSRHDVPKTPILELLREVLEKSFEGTCNELYEHNKCCEFKRDWKKAKTIMDNVMQLISKDERKAVFLIDGACKAFDHDMLCYEAYEVLRLVAIEPETNNKVKNMDDNSLDYDDGLDDDLDALADISGMQLRFYMENTRVYMSKIELEKLYDEVNKNMHHIIQLLNQNRDNFEPYIKHKKVDEKLLNVLLICDKVDEMKSRISDFKESWIEIAFAPFSEGEEKDYRYHIPHETQLLLEKFEKDSNEMASQLQDFKQFCKDNPQVVKQAQYLKQEAIQLDKEDERFLQELMNSTESTITKWIKLSQKNHLSEASAQYKRELEEEVTNEYNTKRKLAEEVKQNTLSAIVWAVIGGILCLFGIQIVGIIILIISIGASFVLKVGAKGIVQEYEEIKSIIQVDNDGKIEIVKNTELE